MCERWEIMKYSFWNMKGKGDKDLDVNGSILLIGTNGSMLLIGTNGSILLIGTSFETQFATVIFLRVWDFCWTAEWLSACQQNVGYACIYILVRALRYVTNRHPLWFVTVQDLVQSTSWKWYSNMFCVGAWNINCGISFFPLSFSYIYCLLSFLSSSPANGIWSF